MVQLYTYYFVQAATLNSYIEKHNNERDPFIAYHLRELTMPLISIWMSKRVNALASMDMGCLDDNKI